MSLRAEVVVDSARVGAIDYLNALPLTRYLKEAGEPALSVSSHSPAVLAEKLRCGELDIALVPVVEYLARKEYRVLPGISIASYGEVRSIRFFHRRELSQLRLVGLDDSSRTSAALTRILFHDLWKGRPELVPLSPADGVRGLESGGHFEGREALDGLLLIGDAALTAQVPSGWESIDLGMEWTRWTGLPLVYALWVWRGGPAPSGLTQKLVAAKQQGIARIDDIVREHCSKSGGDPVSCRHYLYRTIQYDLDRVHIDGLLEYVRRLESLRILPRVVRSAASGEGFLQWLEESHSPPV